MAILTWSLLAAIFGVEAGMRGRLTVSGAAHSEDSRTTSCRRPNCALTATEGGKRRAVGAAVQSLPAPPAAPASQSRQAQLGAVLEVE